MARQIRRVKWYNSDVANETLVNSLVFGSGTGGTCVCAGHCVVTVASLLLGAVFFVAVVEGGAVSRQDRDAEVVLDRERADHED